MGGWKWMGLTATLVVHTSVAVVCAQTPKTPATNQPGAAPSGSTDAAPAAPKPVTAIERREFAIDAPKGQVFRWATAPVTDGDRTIRDKVEYVWRLPGDYDSDKAYDLIVVCHPVGKDCEWAARELDLSQLGSRIIIAPDGSSVIAKGVRSFRNEQTDILAFREFLLEITRTFPAQRIFLTGFEHGGSFALAFAGNFPGLAEGVVTMASEAWPETPMKGGIQQVPLVFVHGMRDEKTPVQVARGLLSEYQTAGHTLLWLIAPEEGTHAPSSAALCRGIDWCEGMVTDDGAGVVAAAKRMLEPVTDAARGKAAPAFGPACQMLRRLMGESENNPAHAPLEEVPAEVRADATALLDQIEAHAARHIEAISREAGKASDLVLNGKPWLGHLRWLREEFRGITAVEQFALRSGFDSLLLTEQAHADELADACAATDPKERFERVVALLPETFALGPLPPATLEALREAKKRAAELKLSEESLEAYENVELLDRAYQQGVAQYRRTLNEWKLPEPAKKKAK